MALKFEYNKAELTAEVCGIEEGDTIAKIPVTTEYYKKTYRVTKIAEDAFRECTALKNIIIPGSVKEIVNGQFKRCSNLESVTISDGVTVIGEEAFHECTNLESIIIPNSVVEIGKEAFAACRSLKSITLPDSVKEISVRSFGSCHNLEYVAIGNGVTRIQHLAFDGCKNLRTITIPDSVVDIDINAFYQCPNLKEFKGKFATEDGRSLVVNNRIISYANASGSTYNIPENVTVIGNCAFADGDGLKVITIPDSVEEIEAYAFCWRSGQNLKEFKGKFATEDGRSLVVNNRIISYANASGSTYDIPDSVTEIGTHAFQHCENLRSVTIPDSVTEIGTYAFQHCENLRSVTIPDNVKEIGGNAFGYCVNLECVKIGKGVTEISPSAFYGCRNLKEVIISDGVIEISREAFYGCSNLKEVSIPSSVKEIGRWAFADGVKVVNIYNDEGNVIIHPHAFSQNVKINYKRPSLLSRLFKKL